MKKIIALFTVLGVVAYASAGFPFSFWKTAAAVGPSTPTRDAYTTDTAHNQVSPLSFSHPQGSLTNGAAIVMVNVASYGGSAVTGITYGGAAMTLLKSASFDSNVYIYGIALGTSASGSKTVSVTFSNEATQFIEFVSVTTYSGVNQSLSFNTAQSTSSACSITSTASTDLICAIAETLNGSLTTSVTTNLNTEFFHVGWSANQNWGVAGEKTGASGSVSVTFVPDYAFANYGIIAVNLTGP